MRKAYTFIAALIVLVGGGAWYAFAYLPGQIQTEIDNAIASVAPEYKVTYAAVDIDVWQETAVFTDVLVYHAPSRTTVQSETASVTRKSEIAADIVLETVMLSVASTDELKVGSVKIDAFRFAKPPGSDAGDNTAKDSPSRAVENLKSIGFDRAVLRRLADPGGAATAQSATLGSLRNGLLKSAEMSEIAASDKDSSLGIKSIAAEDIDFAGILTLPRTLGGYIDWKPLNSGKAAVKAVTLKLDNDISLEVDEVSMDGIKAGRLVRLYVANLASMSKTRKEDAFSFRLKKLELNDFPIITDFPTTIAEMQSFQMRHRSLIYGGFDVRDLDLRIGEGHVTVGHATMPPPTFAYTPSGARYLADATTSMAMNMDLGVLSETKAPLDPQVLKLLNDGRLDFRFSGRSVANHKDKTIALSKTVFEFPGLLSLRLEGKVGNLPLRYFETPGDPLVAQIVLRQMTLGDMDITLSNDGLAEKLFEILAEREGIPADKIAKVLAQAAQTNLTRDGSPESIALADQIARFLEKPKTLRLILKPQRSIRVMDLANPQLLQTTGDVSKVLGLQLIANQEPAR